jgi:hypothetical protein
MGLKIDTILARLKKGGLSSVFFPVIRGLIFIHDGINEIEIIFDEVITVRPCWNETSRYRSGRFR